MVYKRMLKRSHIETCGYCKISKSLYWIFQVDEKVKMLQNYEKISTLGKGTFGSVFLMKNKETDK